MDRKQFLGTLFVLPAGLFLVNCSSDSGDDSGSTSSPNPAPTSAAGAPNTPPPPPPASGGSGDTGGTGGSKGGVQKVGREKALPRVELGLVDSESTVITTTLQRRHGMELAIISQYDNSD